MNVPEMTVGGEKPVDTTVLDNLRRENAELQAFTRGGKWSMIKLKGTFGCSKTHTYAVGRSKRRIHYDVTSLLFDISELKDKQDFTELLKYINTKE